MYVTILIELREGGNRVTTLMLVIAIIGFIASVMHLVGTAKKSNKLIYTVSNLVAGLAALVLFIYFGIQVIS